MGTQVRSRRLKTKEEVMRNEDVARQLYELVKEGVLIDNLDGTFTMRESSIPAPLKN